MPPTPPPDWPADLDAMIAAPAYHSVTLENDSVRVLDTTVPPGHTVPLHTHRWPAVHYILTWSDFIRRDHTGAILLDTRNNDTRNNDTRNNDTRNNPQHPPEGSAQWSGPLAPHTLENVGRSSLRVISVELKNPTQPTNLSSPTQLG
jgi:hypothetical protein